MQFSLVELFDCSLIYMGAFSEQFTRLRCSDSYGSDFKGIKGSHLADFH